MAVRVYFTFREETTLKKAKSMLRMVKKMKQTSRNTFKGFVEEHDMIEFRWVMFYMGGTIF